MTGLVEARRRYAAIRAALPRDCALDRCLHDELTEAIRALDAKIAGGGDARRNGGAPDGGGLNGDGRPEDSPAPARRRHSAL